MTCKIFAGGVEAGLELDPVVGARVQTVLLSTRPCIEGAAEAFLPETLAFLGQMEVEPSTARKVAINDFISSVIAAGIWDLMDVIIFTSAHDEQAGRINWKDPSKVLTNIGSVPFVVDVGFTSVNGGSLEYPDTFANLVNYTQNDNSLGVFTTTLGTPSDNINDIRPKTTLGNSRFNAHPTSLRKFSNNSDNAVLNWGSFSENKYGFFLAQRIAAADRDGYLDTQEFIGSATASVAKISENVTFLNQTGAAATGRTDAFFSIGASLNAIQRREFDLAVRAYLMALIDTGSGTWEEPEFTGWRNFIELTAAISPVYETAMNRVMGKLKSWLFWQNKLGDFYVPAQETAYAAGQKVKAAGTGFFALRDNTTPVADFATPMTPGEGFNPDGLEDNLTAERMDGGITGHFLQNDNHAGLWCLNEITGDATLTVNFTPPVKYGIILKSANSRWGFPAGHFTYRNNEDAVGASFSNPSTKGFWIVQRTAVDLVSVYKDGSQTPVHTSTPASAVNEGGRTFRLFEDDNFPGSRLFGPGKLAVVTFGLSFTLEELTAFDGIFRTYLKEIGTI